jgi:hypothetical protein
MPPDLSSGHNAANLRCRADETSEIPDQSGMSRAVKSANPADCIGTSVALSRTAIKAIAK